MKSLYIHIPFCRKKCLYCDFYSVVYDDAIALAYTKVLIEQIEGLEEEISTIYIGGGTPSVLGEEHLKRLLLSLRRFSVKGLEFTVEANPESLSAGKIAILLDGGVNRLSVGAQSLSDKKLKILGRIHTAAKAREAVYLAKEEGFDNISVDLIFGAPEETLDDWKTELAATSEMPVFHISCYSLTYEKGAPLFYAKEKGIVVALDDTLTADMYSHAIDFLPKQGFEHYEVSNFAKGALFGPKRFYCEHNINYWNNGPYIGIGAAAVSYDGISRSANISDVAEYIKRFNEEKGMGGSRTAHTSERLSQEKRARETAAVKIRMAEGIDFEWFKKKTGFDFIFLEKDVLPELEEKGLIEYKSAGPNSRSPLHTTARLTKKGFLFCDLVSSALV